MNLVKTSYRPEDVTILLKDITGCIEPMSTEQREKKIQSGTHYCEMLPIEYQPSAEYIRLYEYALKSFSRETADGVRIAAERIYADKKSPVLISLARAGLPAGIMIKHYLEKKYDIEVPHFAVSIIRGKGIDRNAMKYILDRFDADRLQFVDGWTGKGAIQNQLNAAMKDYDGIDPRVAVIADPAGITPLCGSHDDFLIASSCLNSVVSGLISRTVLRDDLIGPEDFHGAVYYGEFAKGDRSYEFIDTVESEMTYEDILPKTEENISFTGYDEARDIMERLGISDINFIKPGIGETTRVLLRRVPYKVLIAEDCPEKYVAHIIELAREKNVPVEKYPLKRYRCCGIIRNMPSDA
ncbi:MAG: cysteine protease StiP family protein [Oscillospiraceae bacterium]